MVFEAGNLKKDLPRTIFYSENLSLNSEALKTEIEIVKKMKEILELNGKLKNLGMEGKTSISKHIDRKVLGLDYYRKNGWNISLSSMQYSPSYKVTLSNYFVAYENPEHEVINKFISVAFEIMENMLKYSK